MFVYDGCYMSFANIRPLRIPRANSGTDAPYLDLFHVSSSQVASPIQLAGAMFQDDSVHVCGMIPLRFHVWWLSQPEKYELVSWDDDSRSI